MKQASHIPLDVVVCLLICLGVRDFDQNFGDQEAFASEDEERQIRDKKASITFPFATRR